MFPSTPLRDRPSAGLPFDKLRDRPSTGLPFDRLRDRPVVERSRNDGRANTVGPYELNYSLLG